jgi:uncharacterized membrane protein
VLQIRPGWRATVRGAQAVVVTACVVSSIAAFLSGYQASSDLPDLSPALQDALGGHHAWGRMLLIVCIVMAALFWVSRVATHGRALWASLYYFSLSILIALVLWVGHLGGDLVFQHGMGVSAAAREVK